MQIQTVFKAGNSSVVAIPKELVSELGLRPGQKVVVEKDATREAVVISKATTKKTASKHPKLTKEFREWLKAALVEDGEILDELAER